MDIQSIDQLKAALQAASRKPAQPAQGDVDESAPSFGTALQDALRQVSASQNESESLQRAFQQGLPGTSLEQTMVSMQKAQISFQAAVTVRNRLVAAYTDIMNMTV